jgi:Zn-dependent protease with chaperone function
LPALAPTGYLRALREVLRATEPELWSFFAGAASRADLADDARRELLRSAYRLDGSAHGELVEAAGLAAERLGVTDPVTLYQAQDGSSDAANAMVVSLPGEAHVVFSGRLLELLEGRELVAVVGHELAHHVLWSMEGGVFWVLDRLVHAAASDIGAQPCHLETARLVRLHTELVADRGAMVAADADVDSAVAALVKISTGLRSVSGASYLAQAIEVVNGGPEASAGFSHPEVFVRVWALDRWARDGERVDDEVAERLTGRVDLERLDVLAQRSVSQGVYALVRRFLGYPWATTDAVLGHARLFGEEAVPPTPLRRESLAMPAPLELCPPGLTDLYAYVLLDFATVDEDIEAPALAAALLLSEELGIAKRFDTIVAKELSISAKDVKARRTGAATVLAEAAAP